MCRWSASRRSPGQALRERLRGPAPVRAQLGGTGEVSRLYSLSFADDRVPADLRHRVSRDELDSVEHRFHSDRPGEVAYFAADRVRVRDGEVSSMPVFYPRSPASDRWRC